jgi:hypothetical protein
VNEDVIYQPKSAAILKEVAEAEKTRTEWTPKQYAKAKKNRKLANASKRANRRKK